MQVLSLFPAIDIYPEIKLSARDSDRVPPGPGLSVSLPPCCQFSHETHSGDCGTLQAVRSPCVRPHAGLCM